MNLNRRQIVLATLASGAPFCVSAQKYPGISDTEIRIGSTQPMSGPLSSLSMIGKAAQAYVKRLNDNGGVNGRKVRLIQYDDGYNPGKALEMTRKLVEQDDVSFIFQNVGTATNTAIHRYLHSKAIPQLLIYSGANKWADAVGAPYVIPGTATYGAEGRVYARWLLETKPNARIALLMQNDDFGKDYGDAVKKGLGEHAAKMIVAESTYEVTDPTVDSQVIKLRASNADVLIVLCNGKFAVQALRKVHDIGWKPQVILPIGSSSIQSILKPVGFERAIGAVTVAVAKSAMDPQWDNDPAIVKQRQFVKDYMPGQDPNDQLISAGHASCEMLEEILRRCGNDLSRANIMAKALSLKGFRTSTLLPDVAISVAPGNHELYDRLWLQRFDGVSWVPFGKPVSVA